ncbi:MAG: hypothetical protein HGA90_05565 [Alphaproteobacteria bacterium]|nr:hypothetical protein [Alphaproteobacteria bacterium]
MRGLLFLAALVLVGASSPAFPAKAASATICPTSPNCPGNPCSTLGQTQMSDNQADIIACLKTSETDAALKWKATTGGKGEADCKAETVLFKGTNNHNQLYTLPAARNGDVYCTSIDGVGVPGSLTYLGNYNGKLGSSCGNNAEHGHTVPTNYWCDSGLWYGPSYSTSPGK